LRAIRTIVALVLFFCFTGIVFAKEAKPDQLLIINKKINQMAFYENGELIRIYDVGTGRKPTYTPEGKFKIVNKIKNRPYYKDKIPGGDPRNPLGDRWLGIDAKGTSGNVYAIHGNNNEKSIGKYVSAGCIRMHNVEVRALFDIIQIKTPVIITTSERSFAEIAGANGYALKSTKVEPFENELTLFQTLELYASPGRPDTSKQSIAPQKVKAFERMGNWYHIRTWLGDRWIYAKDALPGKPVVTDETIDLTVQASVYSKPTVNSGLVATLAPQKVTSIERWGSWYRIHTWRGEGWIKL
jgi:hypothetical protein